MTGLALCVYVKEWKHVRLSDQKRTTHRRHRQPLPPGGRRHHRRKIAAIGDLSAAQAGTVIDAAGKTVTPGFIDIHRHADAALFRPHFGELELKQGLTTIVNGNCGLSITPCSGPYRGEIEAYLTPGHG